MENYCFNCMNIKKNEDKCEHCGHRTITDSCVHHLPLGTILNKRYLVGHAIGEGGFGITYIGRDLNLEMIIAIKEYYPTGYAYRNNDASLEVTVTGNSNKDFFEKGKSKFITEARVLAKFSGNKNIVDVRDYFEDNNTAYIVMEYVDGMTLKDYIKSNGSFEVPCLFERMIPLCEALKKVHKSGLIHRDISPDNIMILKDGSMKLMDFGAARDVNFEDKKSLSILLKPGYAPEEQYRSKGKQGPWTDVYAICATMYKCITGVTPDDSMERVFSDELKRPSELGVELSAHQEDALMKGLAIYQKDRFQSIDELIEALSETTTDAISSVNISSPKSKAVTNERNKELFDDDKTEFYDDSNTEEYEEKDEIETTENKEETKETDKKNNDSSSNINKSRKTIVILGVIIAFSIIGIIVGVNLFNGRKVQVPNVIGLTEQEAMHTLRDVSLKEKANYTFSDSTPSGIVISQSKKFGKEVDKDSIITLTVSKGKEIRVPDLVGKTKAEASKLLKEQGLVLKVSKQSYSDKVKKGKIISQVPVSSSLANKDDVVKVVLSKGEKLYVVPNVIGLSKDKAKDLLNKSNFRVKVETQYSDTVANGKVIKQNPKAGKKCKKNTTIVITVSKGAKPQENTSSTSSYYDDTQNYSSYTTTPPTSSNSSHADTTHNEDELVLG